MPNYSKVSHAIPLEKELIKHYIGFDVETSGLIPGVHGIVSLAAIVHDRYGNELGKYVEPCIWPGNDTVFDKKAMKINGLSLTQLRQGIHVRDALQKLQNFYYEWSTNRYILNTTTGCKFTKPGHMTIGHNVGFDTSHVLMATRQQCMYLFDNFKELFRYSYDTMQNYEPGSAPGSLKYFGELHDVCNTAPHTAEGDVKQTLGIFHSMMGYKRLAQSLIVP